jgi:hypothetical protein
MDMFLFYFSWIIESIFLYLSQFTITWESFKDKPFDDKLKSYCKENLKWSLFESYDWTIDKIFLFSFLNQSFIWIKEY